MYGAVMPLLGQDTLNTMTLPHRQLIELLEDLDLLVETEVEFPPKWVDCYLPDYHIAVEADGPQHSRSKDMDRDAYLMATYALPVYRLTDIQLRGDNALKAFCLALLKGDWADTVVERRMLARRAGANL